jgi:methionyl-tRNA formyltransferase
MQLLTDTPDFFKKLDDIITIITRENNITGDNNIVITANYSKLIKLRQLGHNYYLNVHNSLLPKYRGLHAFVWAIINGEQEVGYTCHLINEGIDSGPIISQIKIPILASDDINSLFQKANIILLDWLRELIPAINIDIISRAAPQHESEAIYVCKRKTEDGLIDWSWPRDRVFNLIRALKPPYTYGAFTYLNGEKLVICSSECWNSPNYYSILGQIVAKIPNKGVLVKCGDGLILIKEVIYKESISNAFDLFKTVGCRLKS